MIFVPPDIRTSALSLLAFQEAVMAILWTVFAAYYLGLFPCIYDIG